MKIRFWKWDMWIEIIIVENSKFKYVGERIDKKKLVITVKRTKLL